MIKMIIVGVILVASCSCNVPQKEDTAIRKRVDEFFRHFKALELGKMADYYHPVVFKKNSRKLVLEDMKAQIAGKSSFFKLDIFKIDSLYPVFEIDKKRYAKLTYSIIILIDIRSAQDSIVLEKPTVPATEHTISADSYPAPQATLRRTLIWGSEAGMEELGVDPSTGWSKFRINRQFVAIKDRDANDWFFVSLDEDASPERILDNRVLNKLALYK